MELNGALSNPSSTGKSPAHSARRAAPLAVPRSGGGSCLGRCPGLLQTVNRDCKRPAEDDPEEDALGDAEVGRADHWDKEEATDGRECPDEGRCGKATEGPVSPERADEGEHPGNHQHEGDNA